jgi:hypothetical protein
VQEFFYVERGLASRLMQKVRTDVAAVPTHHHRRRLWLTPAGTYRPWRSCHSRWAAAAVRGERSHHTPRAPSSSAAVHPTRRAACSPQEPDRGRWPSFLFPEGTAGHGGAGPGRPGGRARTPGPCGELLGQGAWWLQPVSGAATGGRLYGASGIAAVRTHFGRHLWRTGRIQLVLLSLPEGSLGFQQRLRRVGGASNVT